MLFMKRLWIISIAIMLGYICSAQTADELFNTGIEKLNAVNFQDAVEVFTKALESIINLSLIYPRKE